MAEGHLTLESIQPRERIFAHLDWVQSEPAIMTSHAVVLGNFLLGLNEGYFFMEDGMPKGLVLLHADWPARVLTVTLLHIRHNARKFTHLFFTSATGWGFKSVRGITRHNAEAMGRLFGMEPKYTILEKGLT